MCMDKPKIDEKYLKIRITGARLSSYLNAIFPNSKLRSFKTISITPFLQKDYGGDGDCTLTSFLVIVKYYKPELGVNEVYNYIEKTAMKYLYRPNWGTFPLFNKAILKEVFKHFGINRAITFKVLKNIGFKSDEIIKQLDQDIPVSISITKDGRQYYENHTITIIGYNQYEDDKGNKKIMFKVYDNWSTLISYLDWDLLREDCAICY